MATPTSLKAEVRADCKQVSNGQSIPFTNAQPTCNYGMRRTITREQGAALEMIGHAVDYLNDSYLHEGPDDEFLDFGAPEMVAVQILTTAQRQILRSLPLLEPLSLRLWRALSRRKSQFKSTTVVPLSSSR